MKKWQILSKIKGKDPQKREKAIIQVLLKNCGLKTKKQIDEFFNPPHPTSYKLRALKVKKKQLEKAIKRIIKAIEDDEQIVVYGDYDADGVCGTAILWETLYQMGAKIKPYIPDRSLEGYGISKKGINTIKKEFDASLIITVDNGITQRRAIDYAKKEGVEVIVTDHHLPPKKLPSAYAIIHTTLLSGSGIAWILVDQILKECNEKSRIAPKTLHFNDYLALAAIGTIADLMPLLGINRSLVKYGLEALNKTKRVGLKALIDEAGLTFGQINTAQISFIIAPRLNATGRMTHALDSLRLLCTTNKQAAQNLAYKLGRVNRDRQKLTEKTVIHARSFREGYSTPEVEKLIFISHESYHEGVIGLVAGKLVEEFYRPAIVVSQGKEISKASARSIDGFNIVEAIRACSDLLVDCGGHAMAAGFTAQTIHLKTLKQKLEQLAQENIGTEKLKKTLKIDCEIDLADVGFDLYEKVCQFEPFGLGNPEPVFAVKGVLVLDARVVGRNGKHLKLVLKQKDTLEESLRATIRCRQDSFEAIAFGMGDVYPKLSQDQPIDIAFGLLANEWNGKKRLQLKVRDIKLTPLKDGP